MKYIKLFENIDQLNASNLEMCFDGLSDFGLNVDAEINNYKGQEWIKIIIYKFCAENANKFDSYILIPGKFSNTKIGVEYYKIDNKIIEEVISSIGRSIEFGFTKMEKISAIVSKADEDFFYEFEDGYSLYKMANKKVQTISILYYL